MSATAGQAQGERGLAERLGLKPGQVVQEIGWDEDVDEKLRESIEDLTGNELLDVRGIRRDFYNAVASAVAGGDV